MRKATLLILLLNAGLAFGQVYSWKDANGGVHYSDQPPSDTDAQKLNVPTAPSTEGASASKSWSDKEADFRKRQATSAEADAKAAKDRKLADDKQVNCERARNSLQGIESGQIRYKMGSNGERQALDGSVRDGEIARAREAADSWCK
jgi:hypothetical protein